MMLFGWAIGADHRRPRPAPRAWVPRASPGPRSSSSSPSRPCTTRSTPCPPPCAGSPISCPRPRSSRACAPCWSSTASTAPCSRQAVAVLLVWLVVGGVGLHAAVPERAAARAAAAVGGVAMLRLTILAAATLLAGPAVAADCGNATSQLALDQCAAAELQAADTSLNAAYQQILGRLRGDPTRPSCCAPHSAPGSAFATVSAHSPPRPLRRAASTRCSSRAAGPG